MRYFALLLLLLAGTANAIEVCWQPPTENVDGTPITDLPLAYRVHYGVASRTYTDTILLDPAPVGDCHSWSPAPGEYYIAVTAIDSDGEESAYSNEVLKTESGGPMPPVILEQDETVFNVIKQPNRFVLLPIGTAPAGTSCDPNNSVNGHGAVPTDDVIWAPGSTVRPVVVVALCDG